MVQTDRARHRPRIVKADEARRDGRSGRDDGRDREAAEAWDAIATHTAKQADVCRHGAELADRTRHR